LKVVQGTDGQLVTQGSIYVAAPDHHILLEGKKILIKKGPKENRFRPSVDALFRSAAYVYGARVIGVVLSGLMNDGTSGLWTIKRMGGLTVVQNPADAEYPDMPENALEYVKVDHSVNARDIGPLLQGLFKMAAKPKRKIPKKELELLKTEVIVARKDGAFKMGIMDMGELTPLTCPECHGVLVQLGEGKLIRYRCHTGHAYTASALLAEVTEAAEEHLWQAMRAMEECTMVLDKIGTHFKEQGQPKIGKVFLKKSKEMDKRAQVIHDSVLTQELLSEDIRHKKRRVKN
jgi:two-component system chemotaxis response regulator CheB